MEPHAPYSSFVVANEFIRLAQKNGGLTHMQLQKLIYFAHVESLRKYGQPLVKGVFQAWTYGPVDISVYLEFRGSGKEKISEIKNVSDQIDSNSKAIIKEVYVRYGQMSAWQLSEMTHDENSPFGRPWYNAYKEGESNPIFNDDIIN
ncbi:MAG: DUF4065 domain-containing protein [Acetobacter sp.]|nr:DUF4065 domain-containing protein [Acetobacter sp.]